MVYVESASITDIGRKRQGNEDALFVDDDLRLYLVADGMGGHRAGEVASMLVVETVRDYMKAFNEKEDSDPLYFSNATLSRDAGRLLTGIQLANWDVYCKSHANDACSGMGSTLSAVYVTDEKLVVANVGDSPIFLVHNGTIELVSVIHNLKAQKASVEFDFLVHSGGDFDHILTRAMGTEPSVKPDIFELPYFDGDMLVMSSDGLSDKVSPEEILEIVNNQNPENACKLLVEMANDRGGDDNITAIVLKIKNT